MAVDEQTIANMKARVALCRRLAKTTSDPNTAMTLRHMADEGQADIERMLKG